LRPHYRNALALLIAFWERLRASHALKGLFLFAIVALIALAAATLPTADESPFADAERFAFDQQMRLLRQVHPRPLADDIVLIGTDEETYQVFDEPIALWHQHFADVLHALARAKPRAVGVDFVLPEKSFDRISPGIDLAMMRGLLDLKRATVMVYVQTIGRDGNLVPVQANFRNIVTDENLGVDQHLRDTDSTSRRFEKLTAKGSSEEIPTLVSQMLHRLGLRVDEGYIDYSLGAPLEYIALHRVAQMDDAELRKTFANRIVLMGSLVGFVDRWRLPTKLLRTDPGRPQDAAADAGEYTQPGVLIHLQALRSQVASGMLHRIPWWGAMLGCALAALAVFIRPRPWLIAALVLGVPILAAIASLAAIVKAQTLIPIASLTATFWLAIATRAVFDAIAAVVEKIRLQQSFAGQVSPAVMREMLGGNLTPGVSGQLAEVCVLFSDVRDFTTLSENMPPEVVTTVLQRYFDRMVKAVHRYDGTVDKFIGDGMMVLFGAPRKSADPCGDAVRCALAMMEGLDALNEEFRREALPTLTIGIGVNFGTVTVGNIGSSERHNYSAIGDAVNVAARLEGLTKEIGRKILITEAVVSRMGDNFQFDPLGSHKVKGHSPVNVWGIRTVRAAPATSAATASA
jgi:class 3 adenylate cyclase/CHASE2 domain-containing sensor protein